MVSLANHQEWLVLSRDKYEVPSFDSIADLAAYTYESAAVVANDSGNGHLASFLGVPVVTIYKKHNEKFHWRPSWGDGKVICPKLVVKFGSIRIWRPFVTKRMVLKTFDKLLD